MCGAAVNEPSGERLFGELGAPVIEAREKVGGDGFTGLDFDGLEGVGAGRDESVDFVAFLVAEEMKGGFDAAVGLGFEQFRHGPVFKQVAALGMSGDVGGNRYLFIDKLGFAVSIRPCVIQFPCFSALFLALPARRSLASPRNHPPRKPAAKRRRQPSRQSR